VKRRVAQLTRVQKVMALYTSLHLHNVSDGREPDYAKWFDGPHQRAVSGLRGLKTADRYEVTREQIMPDIVQPWRFLSVYEFDCPEPGIDLPALGPLLAEARAAGLIDDTRDTERIYSYRMYSDWKGSANWHPLEPFSGVSIILGNYTIGREAEYHKWYDEVHSVEVTDVPGHVAMKRGALSDIQIGPHRYCPGNQLVFTACQTEDLAFTVGDFSARANGRSPSGIAMTPRSKAGSFARTVHYFKKTSGHRFWGSGIAYAGDLGVYRAVR
jgi:hypothetical protein